MLPVSACVTIEIFVDVDADSSTIDSNEVGQAVQDAIGHTGAKVVDVVDWREDVPGE